MKLLVTGGTGFLGKKVLSLLASDPRVERIDAVTRSLETHPDPKIRVLRADLAETSTAELVARDIDCVVHLAGLHDPGADFSSCYLANVVVTLNLLERCSEIGAPILLASTYAVGAGSVRPLDEEPTDHLPPRSMAYAYTKALAEKAVLDSAVPAWIFRIGLLVGDSRHGMIEKLDGPYPFLRQLRRLSALRGSSLIPGVPIPANPDSVLPLVPVDTAARVLAEGALRLGSEGAGGKRIYGVYDASSAALSDLCEAALRRYLPRAKPWFLRSRRPGPVALAASTRFAADFQAHPIPRFSELSETLFKGFEEFEYGTTST